MLREYYNKEEKETDKGEHEMSSKKNLVIVESPAKAKTLKKFLGSNYKIEASVAQK